MVFRLEQGLGPSGLTVARLTLQATAAALAFAVLATGVVEGARAFLLTVEAAVVESAPRPSTLAGVGGAR